MNRTDYGLFEGRPKPPLDKTRFLSRIEVFPAGRQLPDDLAEQLLTAQRERPLWCIDQGPACIALLVDLNDDGEDEVAVSLSFAHATVYAKRGDAWHAVGGLNGLYGGLEDLRAALTENRLRALPPARYHGVEIGKNSFVFTPCSPGDPHCVDSPGH